jgi:hypothetical protein
MGAYSRPHLPVSRAPANGPRPAWRPRLRPAFQPSTGEQTPASLRGCARVARHAVGKRRLDPTSVTARSRPVIDGKNPSGSQPATRPCASVITRPAWNPDDAGRAGGASRPGREQILHTQSRSLGERACPRGASGGCGVCTGAGAPAAHDDHPAAASVATWYPGCDSRAGTLHEQSAARDLVDDRYSPGPPSLSAARRVGLLEGLVSAHLLSSCPGGGRKPRATAP